jgi:hypothetical protein
MKVFQFAFQIFCNIVEFVDALVYLCQSGDLDDKEGLPFFLKSKNSPSYFLVARFQIGQ